MDADFAVRYGRYAVVTGASAGIGAEFARQLAGRGLSLVLVARREERLTTLADELSTTYGVDARVLSVDLLAEDAAELVARETANLDVGLVVLNAGVIEIGPFVDTDLRAHTELATVNAVRTMQLSHLLGSRLVVRRRGGMVFVASLSGSAPGPYLAHYAASKAYLTSLGQALRVEWGREGIDVVVLSPGLVDTDMVRGSAIGTARTPFPVTEPRVVVTAALDGLGRRPVVIPGAVNKLTDVVLRRVVSRRLAPRVLAPFLKQLVGP